MNATTLTTVRLKVAEEAISALEAALNAQGYELAWYRARAVEIAHHLCTAAAVHRARLATAAWRAAVNGGREEVEQ